MVTRELGRIRERMVAAAGRVGRDPAAVTLVAVSKGHPVSTIMEAYQAGQRDFGENRAVELEAKAAQLPDDIRWHFIGSLQTRQVKTARPYTHLLHSLDRARLVHSWAAEAGAPRALLQVNIAAEPQKHGATPAEAPLLLAQAATAGIECVGLMTIPPLAVDPEDSREWFRELAALKEQLSAHFPGLIHLSMGMTDDYEVAIEEGATMIRVGRAIFGEPGPPVRID